MAQFLSEELGSIAFCWRLERRDGCALGFTTHDPDLEIAGLVYRAAPGMLPSSITLCDSFEADSLDVAGALSSASISERDLTAGRWDGAQVSIFMIDWTRPNGEQQPVARGTIGDVSIAGNGFSAELRGPTALLERAVVEQTSPECRAALGDKRCRVDMAARIRIARIAQVVEEAVFDFGEASSGNAYGYGRLRWLSGANSGLESAILKSAGARLTLREPPTFAASTGDLVELSHGCDKSLATCIARFANAANFRGEPHLPGMDLLTRYPGA